MTETTNTQPQPAKPASKIWGYITALASFIIAAIALLRFFDTSLPGCTSTRANDTLRSLMRDKNVTGVTFSEQREIAKDPNEVRCSGVMQTQDGTRHSLTYRIYRENSQTMVAAEWRRL